MRDFMRMVSVLFVACGLAAGSLAVVNAVTKEPISTLAKRERDAALQQVSPAADEFRNVVPDRAWEAFRNGEKAGHVFLTQTQGYSGPITLMFGTDSAGAVTGLRVLNHTETPGLGAKVARAQFTDQFRGKLLDHIVLKKDDPARGQIDAVTGATVSSRAVTRTARATLESFTKDKAGEDK